MKSPIALHVTPRIRPTKPKKRPVSNPGFNGCAAARKAARLPNEVAMNAEATPAAFKDWFLICTKSSNLPGLNMKHSV